MPCNMGIRLVPHPVVIRVCMDNERAAVELGHLERIEVVCELFRSCKDISEIACVAFLGGSRRATMSGRRTLVEVGTGSRTPFSSKITCRVNVESVEARRKVSKLRSDYDALSILYTQDNPLHSPCVKYGDGIGIYFCQ